MRVTNNVLFNNTGPEVAVKTPEVAVKTPEVAVKTPEVAVKTPEVAVQAPEVAVQAPEVAVLVPGSVQVPEDAMDVDESMSVLTPKIDCAGSRAHRALMHDLKKYKGDFSVLQLWNEVLNDVFRSEVA